MTQQLTEHFRGRAWIPCAASPRCASRSAGFTLIELLVTLGLLAILGSSLAGVLRNASDSINTATATLDEMTRMRSLDLLLGGAIHDAVAVELSDSEQTMLTEDGDYDTDLGTYRFRGEAYSLGFCIERPFLSAERDGYMHWVALDVVEQEDSELFSLWLKDISFLQEIDNPVGEDWGGMGMLAEECLPNQSIRLMSDLVSVNFSYWVGAEDDADEDEEIEAENIEGDYALELPDRIEMDFVRADGSSEHLVFTYNLRGDLL